MAPVKARINQILHRHIVAQDVFGTHDLRQALCRIVQRGAGGCPGSRALQQAAVACGVRQFHSSQGYPHVFRRATWAARHAQQGIVAVLCQIVQSLALAFEQCSNALFAALQGVVAGHQHINDFAGECAAVENLFPPFFQQGLAGRVKGHYGIDVATAPGGHMFINRQRHHCHVSYLQPRLL